MNIPKVFHLGMVYMFCNYEKVDIIKNAKTTKQLQY